MNPDEWFIVDKKLYHLHVRHVCTGVLFLVEGALRQPNQNQPQEEGVFVLPSVRSIAAEGSHARQLRHSRVALLGSCCRSPLSKGVCVLAFLCFVLTGERRCCCVAGLRFPPPPEKSSFPATIACSIGRTAKRRYSCRPPSVKFNRLRSWRVYTRLNFRGRRELSPQPFLCRCARSPMIYVRSL